jgi:hypothetical protein
MAPPDHPACEEIHMRSWWQLRFGGVALALIVVSIGCATANREALQRGIAPEKLQCDEKQITMTPFAGETRIFTGCGREVWFTCASFPSGEQCFPMQDLRARASFEMDCADKATITFTPLDAAGHTVGASACGKRTVYQYVQTAAWKYDWVATSNASAESR